jgi:6-pyruvoyltetrahydropterin/6-carboxytetrahydropterin synthase
MPYEISTEVTFSGAHFIAGYPGDCARMHGHNWRVRAAVKAERAKAGSGGGGAGAGGSGPAGLTYDFRKLRALLGDIAALVDHSVLNDLPYFKDRNPTAEAIAEWFYGEIEKRIGSEAAVARVEVWESGQNCAVFTRD